MTRQCCICKKVFRDGEWVSASTDELAPEDITHGYCDACFEEYLKSLDDFASSFQLATVSPI